MLVNRTITGCMGGVVMSSCTRTRSAAAALPLIIFLLGISISAHQARAAGGLFCGMGRPEVLSADFSGVAATFFLDRDLVESWLPPGLRLAEECPFEDHPVIILFGTQRDLTRQKWLTLKPRWGRCYLETFVAVPYLKLQHCQNGKPVFHFVRAYLNNMPATTQGIKRFGWPKICTPIHAGGREYRILRGTRGAVFEADTDYGKLKAVDSNNESLRQIQQMLSQTLVLRHRGRLDRYRFNFHFNTARISPAATRIQLREGFMPGLDPTEVAIAGIDEADFGAFAIQCRFTKVAR